MKKVLVVSALMVASFFAGWYSHSGNIQVSSQGFSAHR